MIYNGEAFFVGCPNRFKRLLMEWGGRGWGAVDACGCVRGSGGQGQLAFEG